MVEPRHPPGPPRLPLIGNLLTVRMGSLNDLGPLAARYGPVFSLRLGVHTVVVLASADAIHEVCVANAASCSARPRLLNTDVISGGGRSTLLGNGDAWSARRRLLTRAFLQARHLPELTTLLNAELCSIMDRFAPTGRKDVTVRLYADVLSAAQFAIAARLLTATSGNDSGEFHAIRAAVEAESRHFGPMLADFVPLLRPFVRLGGLRAHIRRFHAIFSARIRDRRSEIEQGRRSSAVLDSLLVERERMRSAGHPELDSHCDDETLPYMLYNIFGTMNPTHIAVMRTVRLLLQHPETLRRTRDELDRVLGPVDPDRPPESTDLDQLVFLRAVVQETMRLQPPTPSLVPRLVTEDIVTSHGYLIPRGAILLANVASGGHDQHRWPEPHRFRPERFLPDQPMSPDLSREGAQLLAFGVGPRACPARLLGTRIVVLWLVHLLRRFDLQLTDPAPSGRAGFGSRLGRRRDSAVDAHIFNDIPQDFRLRLVPRPAGQRTS